MSEKFPILDQVRIMSLPGTQQLANQILSHLDTTNKGKAKLVSYIYERFYDGDGKIALQSSIRDKILFLLVDPYHYGETYNFRGQERATSPDEHIKNVHRAISATNGKEKGLYIVSPLLYQARQDRRNGKNESLDMSIELNNQKDRAHKLEGIIAVDVHNPAAFENSLTDYDCINLFPTVPMLKQLIKDIPNQLTNILVIGPDGGAAHRARIFADLLDQSPCSNFHKRRDFSKKDTILEHTYNGNPEEVKGKCVIIPDDIIASGTTMLDVAQKSKEMGAESTILMASHATFTKGGEPFDEAFSKGYFDKLYTTNLSYIPEAIKNRKRYQEVDCSNMLTNTMFCLCNGNSITESVKEQEKKLLEEVQKLKITS